MRDFQRIRHGSGARHRLDLSMTLIRVPAFVTPIPRLAPVITEFSREGVHQNRRRHAVATRALHCAQDLGLPRPGLPTGGDCRIVLAVVAGLMPVRWRSRAYDCDLKTRGAIIG